MNKKSLSVLVVLGFVLLFSSCKDPREKTIWDYIDNKSHASEYEYQQGIKMLHRDLVKHGYMKEHSCYQLDCFNHHVNTYADIERVNALAKE